jgi:hypothetical protein
MLKCIPITAAKKLGPIATTYRSKGGNPFGTCPSSCPLLPKNAKGTANLDEHYLETVLGAAPRKGIAWGYTHFPLASLQAVLPTAPATGTTINISTDTVDQATEAVRQGWPTVFAAPWNWEFKPPTRFDNIRFITCPAAKSEKVTCATCGGGDPLCYRKDRDYVVVFPAHGSLKRQVGLDQPGGCYGSTGNTWTQWMAASNGIGRVVYPDHEEREGLQAWVQSLPSRSMLRHHIVGDLGES